MHFVKCQKEKLLFTRVCRSVLGKTVLEVLETARGLIFVRDLARFTPSL